MIAHISPADVHREESRNTLVYADRAKNISNKVHKNVLDVSFHVTQYQSIIADLKGEIGRLKDKINNDAVSEMFSIPDIVIFNFSTRKRRQVLPPNSKLKNSNYCVTLWWQISKNK